MNYYYLRCRSVTYAQRAVKTLEKAGIIAAVVKLPQRISEDGCGYSIKVAERKLHVTIEVLKKARFEISGIYYADGSGEYIEVEL